jgi:hypothetical protein
VQHLLIPVLAHRGVLCSSVVHRLSDCNAELSASHSHIASSLCMYCMLGVSLAGAELRSLQQVVG